MRSFSQFLYESKVSIKKHKTLRSELFNTKTNQLKPEVRKQMLKIANAWAEFLEIPKSAIERVDFVGSSAGYLYHENSDADIHLILDLSRISKCDGLLREYLRAKKKVWENQYGKDGITLNGVPAEVYGEDIDDPRPRLQARYDVTNNKWINEADPEQIPNVKDIEIQTKAEVWEDRVEDAIEDEIENIETLNRLKDRILNLRKSSMDRGDEYGESNLVYKVVRANGSLDRLDRYMKGVEANNLSL
tara:strand:- start:3476 stop:4213 length:738 start_codon:yes stop_codon:yes gene_type:complete